MGRHPQQRQMFQFDHHHNEADDVTSRSVLLGSAGGEAKQLTTRLGVGDRTFRSASAAPIAHGRGVQRREPDGVAVSSTLHVRMDGTLVSSVLPWCDSRHASRTGLQCGTVTQERRPRANTDATRLGFPARTATSMNDHSQSGSRSRLETACSGNAPRSGSVSLVAVNKHVTRAEIGEILNSFCQALRLFLRPHQDEEGSRRFWKTAATSYETHQ